MNLFWKNANGTDEALQERTKTDKIVFADVETRKTLYTEPQMRDVETLVEMLKDRKSRYRKGFVYWSWMISSPIIGISLMISIANSNLEWVLIALFGLLTVRALIVMSERIRIERAALQNSHLEKDWVGPLCEALEWPDKHVQGSAARLLTQFLPRLGEEDASLLNDEQLTCLYRRLGPRRAALDPELAATILRSLPMIGTEDAMLYVKKLTSFPFFSFKGKQIRDGAHAIQALLEKRVLTQRVEKRADANLSQISIGKLLELRPEKTSTECEEKEKSELDEATADLNKELTEFESELKKLQVPGMRFGFLIATWCVVVPYGVFQTVYQCIGGNWIGGSVFGALTALSTQFHRLTLMGQHKLLARRLAKIDDVRCISRLAEVLEWPDPMVRDVAISALTRLLPKVKASDKVLQTVRQKSNLQRMLVLPNAQRHAAFLVNLLKALEQIGDESALPYIQQLAKAAPTSSQQRRVCDAARECLPYLELRSELARSSQTLLRASSASNVGIELLVRPASAGGATDQSELLRPSSNQPEI